MPGHRYRSRAGVFEVEAVHDSTIDIRYMAGLSITLPRRAIWEQWRRIVDERREADSPLPPDSGDAPLTDDAIRAHVLELAGSRSAASAMQAIGEYLLAAGWATAMDLRAAGGTYWLVPEPARLALCDQLMGRLTGAGVQLERGTVTAGGRPPERRPAWRLRPA
jgi:hypothetical protein